MPLIVPTAQWERIRRKQIESIVLTVAFQMSRELVAPQLIDGFEIELRNSIKKFLDSRDKDTDQPVQSQIITDVSVLIVDLARPGKLCVDGGPVIGLEVADRWLRNKGWIAVKENWRDDIVVLPFETAGIGRNVEEILVDCWEFQGLTIGRAFEDVYGWAKDEGIQ